MSTWLAGKHVHADVDQQATLDLPHDGPGNHIPLFAGGDDLFPVADPLRLPAGELDHPLLVVEFFQQNFDLLARLRRRFTFVPLIRGNNPLALATHVEQNIVSLATQNDPGENLACLEEGRIDNHRLKALQALGLQHRGEHRVQFIVVDREFTNEVAIYHGPETA